jgi:hypothetical protein
MHYALGQVDANGFLHAWSTGVMKWVCLFVCDRIVYSITYNGITTICVSAGNFNFCLFVFFCFGVRRCSLYVFMVALLCVRVGFDGWFHLPLCVLYVAVLLRGCTIVCVCVCVCVLGVYFWYVRTLGVLLCMFPVLGGLGWYSLLYLDVCLHACTDAFAHAWGYVCGNVVCNCVVDTMFSFFSTVMQAPPSPRRPCPQHQVNSIAAYLYTCYEPHKHSQDDQPQLIQQSCTHGKLWIIWKKIIIIIPNKGREWEMIAREKWPNGRVPLSIAHESSCSY